MIVSLDFETRSLADLPDVGAWAYSQHPSTEILCCAVSIDGAPAVCYDCRKPENVAYITDLLQRATLVKAWNVAFEYAMITNVWHLLIEAEKFFDTTAKALAMSLPAALGKCGAALNLPVQKDKEGDRLIKLFSMPASAGRLKGQLRNTTDHEEDFARFMDYCRQDVEAERAIDTALPDLSDADHAFWATTWITNLRGVPMDCELVAGLSNMVRRGAEVIGAAVSIRTEGVLDGDSVKNNHAKTAKYLELPSVAKAYVKDLLAQEDVDPKTREILEARQALGRTAVAKLPKFKSYMGADQRVRFVHRFNGALSGRDTSIGCNFMNLPRGDKFDVPKLIAAAKADDWETFFEASRWLMSKAGPVACTFDPLGAVVACLRGCLAPKQGVFMQCDYASIEPRMLAWYSGQEWELDAWRKFDRNEGPDLYRVYAGAAWGIEPKAVSGDQRQMGKVGKLLSQYRGGWKTLQKSGKDQYGLLLDEAQARFLVDSYRATHRENVAFWHNTEAAAIKAVKRPNTIYSVGKAAYRFDGVHLQCRLASGRKITYPYASVEMADMPWCKEDGTPAQKECLFYYCEVGPAKQWKKDQTHGGILVNHIVQGTSACLLRYACNALEAAGFKVVLRIYDELVVEAPDDSRFEEFKRIMLAVPEWADGLPIAGAGWCGERYKKDG